MTTPLQVLKGHTTIETAYVVNDYPYGFRLRCKIRYWLEYAKGKGFRLCSQTTNPKVPVERWNTPKKSTYSMLGVMGLDEQGHVTWTGCSMYDFEKLAEFETVYGTQFDETQQAVCTAARKAYERYQAAKAARERLTAATPAEAPAV
jgi:hypothetical protein